jgi:putative redox protein
MAGNESTGTNTVVARWRGGFRCDVDTGAYTIAVDEPVDVGGTGLGPMPTDLLLASLSSCYALALAWAARKRGFELPDLEVTATGTYDGPRFRAFALSVSSSLPDEQLTKLFAPASRACYVSNTLAQTRPITVSSAGTPPVGNTPSVANRGESAAQSRVEIE